MGRGILKLAPDEYIEWSTVVDAPVSYVLDREEAVQEFGEERIERADKTGTSYYDRPPQTAEEFVEFNRAGENETRLDLEGIRYHYRKELRFI
jgi:hypothetical protein